MFKKTTNNYSYIGIGIGIGRYENFDIGILSVSADKEKGIIGPISVSADMKKSLSVYRWVEQKKPQRYHLTDASLSNLGSKK